MWVCGSNFDSHCTVISLDLQKPKNVVIDASHSTVLLRWDYLLTILSRACKDVNKVSSNSGYLDFDALENLMEPRHVIN